MSKKQSVPPVFRVKFVYDEEAEFEECNGENRPLTKAEYAENTYRACPDHPRAGTIVVNEDPPYTSAQIQGCAVCRRTDYVEIPYAEYRAYYGNPERHIYLGCVVERETRCTCGESAHWNIVESLWGIDVMDTDRAYLGLTLDRWYTAADAAALPGYAGDVVRELLQEARS